MAVFSGYGLKQVENCWKVLKTMDFRGQRRYHPFAPPVDAHHGRNQPFPNGQTGAWNGRYSRVHRGLGSQRSLSRGMFHHPPEHSSVSTNKTPFYPRYLGPQPRLSWFQGRSMHYGVPRPPTNYYSEQRERNFRWPSYRAARYGPYPRLPPKHMGTASSCSTGLVWTYSDGRAEGHRHLNYFHVYHIFCLVLFSPFLSLQLFFNWLILELHIPFLIMFLELQLFAPKWTLITAQKVHVNNDGTSTMFRF